jgi:hypothetical protein
VRARGRPRGPWRRTDESRRIDTRVSAALGGDDETRNSGIDSATPPPALLPSSWCAPPPPAGAAASASRTRRARSRSVSRSRAKRSPPSCAPRPTPGASSPGEPASTVTRRAGASGGRSASSAASRAAGQPTPSRAGQLSPPARLSPARLARTRVVPLASTSGSAKSLASRRAPGSSAVAFGRANSVGRETALRRSLPRAEFRPCHGTLAARRLMQKCKRAGVRWGSRAGHDRRLGRLVSTGVLAALRSEKLRLIGTLLLRAADAVVEAPELAARGKLATFPFQT